jgi:hypothetical protein
MEGFNKDIRKIIYQKLNKVDLEVLRVSYNPTYVPISDIGCYAAGSGYLELLIWARNIAYISTYLYIAIENGHLNILQWFTSENLVKGNLNRYVCHLALRKGNLDVLDWAVGLFYFYVRSNDWKFEIITMD